MRPPYERIKFVYPLENVRFLLLSTNLAREWLQIDTDLLRIITSTADKLSSGTNIDDLEGPWTPKIGVLVNFSLFWATAYTERVNFRRNCWRSTRQPAYEILLMLWRVSWALAQISCKTFGGKPIQYFTRLFAIRIQQEIWANAHGTRNIISVISCAGCLCLSPVYFSENSL